MQPDLALIFSALEFAAYKHRNQRRLNPEASPYINHPIQLAQVLTSHGVTDTATLCAAILHDTIEDTDTTADELRAQFGDEITALVLEVTDDTSLPYLARKQAQIDKAARSSDKAKLIKLADKICNISDLASAPPTNWTPKRVVEYFEWSYQVVGQIRDAHDGLVESFDLAYSRKPDLK